MTSSSLLNTGFLWRAVVVSLLLHAFLLLQSMPRVHVSPEPPLVAVLRSDVKTQHPETPTAVSSSATAKNAGTRAEPSDTFVVPLPSEPIAAAPPKPDPAAMDFGEAEKSYLFSLAREMRHGKRMLPDSAAGFAGTSEIRISIAGDGSAAPPLLFKSSGYPELDQAALTMVGAALQRTQVPAGLLGQAFDLVLPISFGFAE